MKEIRQQFSIRYEFPVLFTRGAFRPDNPALAHVFPPCEGRRHRVLVTVDSDLVAHRAGLTEQIRTYFEAHGDTMQVVAPPVAVCGGEGCKNTPDEVRKIQELIEAHHLCRQSFVLALGGGAVLDAVGFAAATAHRGIRLIRMPSTVLGQNDAGVGVKNGINWFGKKNWLGTFAPPYAIVNDFELLETLSPRDLRSGTAEAVKVALIRDARFFDSLHRERHRLRAFDWAAMEPMITRCAELHLEHIATSGDPFEFGSARPLDFGHWSAHRLEELSQGELRHGEAVAIGIALDSLYAERMGLISEFELARILTTLEDIGFELRHWSLDWLDVGAALESFREHLGGELTITLLQGIGGRIEVHHVDVPAMEQCIRTLSARRAERPGADRRLEPGAAPPAGARSSR